MVNKSRIIGILLPAVINCTYVDSKLERNPFTVSVKRRVLKAPKNRCAICAICRSKLDQYVVDFDHINGNSTNNKIKNCQALCTPCHRKKHASI